MNLTQMQNKIFEHYGRGNQLGKLQEELEELCYGVDAMLSGGVYQLSSLIGEIADVENVIDQIKNYYKINNEVKVIKNEKCERQLKRMENEMQDTQEMQVEMDNTAQQVESLVGSALTMSERDIESAIDSGWNGKGLPPVGCECRYHCANPRMADLMKHHDKLVDCVAHVGIYGKLAVLVSKDYSFSTVCNDAWIRPSLTEDQIQARIDEKNGELLYSLVAKVLWDTLGRSTPSYSSDADNKYYEELAKQIDFPGKIKD